MNTFDELIQKQVELAGFTSWNIGGPAEFYMAPRDLEALRQSVIWAKAKGHRITILGGGSNVLISDAGIKGLVIHLRFFTGSQVEVRSESTGVAHLKIESLAGTSKSELLKIFLKHQLTPALFLGGLPGDVGGGVVMNAGVGEALVPREFCEMVEWVEVLKTDDPKMRIERYAHDQLQWRYRHTDGWQPGVITKVGFSWPNQPDPQVREKVREANTKRLKSQPLEWPSCGSVFQNPPGEKAGRLIESCGLKGLRMGQAQISEKHANFIINLGGAKAVDVRALIEKVQAEVENKTGVRLQTEVVTLN